MSHRPVIASDEMYARVAFLVLVVFSVSVELAKLPPYIQPCKKGPDFNKCALENGNKAIPGIVKGDRAYKIPPMTPLRIPKIAISANQINITLTDNDIHGLENTVIKNIDFNYDKQTFKVTVFIPKLSVFGKSEINGRILLLPLQGSGPGNITFVDLTFTYQYDYELVEKNKKMYQSIVKTDVDYKMKRAYFNFENLFNGNQLLGDQINSFLNENWKDVDQEIGSPLGQAVTDIINGIVLEIMKKVPYNEFFTT